MTPDLISEDDLRAALRPHQVDPEKFAAAVEKRMRAIQSEAAADPLVGLPRLARAAAAFLPLEVLAGCQVLPATAKAAQVSGLYKLLSYLAFPAISLFILLGATLFSFLKVRSIQDQSNSDLADQQAVREAVQTWWRQHRPAALAVFAASLALMVFGATSLLFFVFLLSLGLVVYVLSSFAKVGIGNREVVGRTCGLGLMFLGQVTASVGMGSQEMHFLDQSLVSVVFFAGVLMLLPYTLRSRQIVTASAEEPMPTPNWFWILYAVFALFQLGLIAWIWSQDRLPINFRIGVAALLGVGALLPPVAIFFAQRMKKRGQSIGPARGLIPLILLLILPLMSWNARSLLWPVTPANIKRYVESFHDAPHSSASWANWEIAAQWTIDAQLNPDLLQPRQLLATEIAGAQNPYILSTAMRVGLISPGELGQLRNYDKQRHYLLSTTPGILPQSVHLGQYDWVVRAAVLKNDLSPTERDELERRLLATIDGLSADKHATLETALRATQLLSVIGRPVSRDQYRSQIHDLLRTFHHTAGGWGLTNGGFKSYRNIRAGDLKATAHAVELMETFGVPDDLDMLWVRSFLRSGGGKVLHQKWIAAATLARLNALPVVHAPVWLDYLYYERTLLAAIALVSLCLYATFSSPTRKFSWPNNQPCPC